MPLTLINLGSYPSPGPVHVAVVKTLLNNPDHSPPLNEVNSSVLGAGQESYTVPAASVQPAAQPVVPTLVGGIDGKSVQHGMAAAASGEKRGVRREAYNL